MNINLTTPAGLIRLLGITRGGNIQHGKGTFYEKDKEEGPLFS
jgi:hypothetical protein